MNSLERKYSRSIYTWKGVLPTNFLCFWELMWGNSWLISYSETKLKLSLFLWHNLSVDDYIHFILMKTGVRTTIKDSVSNSPYLIRAELETLSNYLKVNNWRKIDSKFKMLESNHIKRYLSQATPYIWYIPMKLSVCFKKCK